MRWPVAFPLLTVLLAGCRPDRNPPVATGPTPVDPWIITSFDSSGEPALLWNGLDGFRIGPDGTGLGLDGKPLPFFQADAYQTKGEEKIQALPTPLGVPLTIDGVPVSVKGATKYSQMLDMRTGGITIHWQQPLPDGGIAAIQCETVLDPEWQLLGQRWSAVTSKKAIFRLTTSTAGDLKEVAPLRPTMNGKTIDQTAFYQTPMMNVGVFNRIVADTVRSSSLFAERMIELAPSPNREKMMVRAGIMRAATGVYNGKVTSPISFEDLEQRTEKVWKKRWKTDIVIDGPVEDQQAVHALLFYLRSAINPRGDMSLSPFGLSADRYFGHVFWDADMWVFPALSLIDPESAKAIARYRLQRTRAAATNFDEWIKAGRPVDKGKLGPIPTGAPGLKFPWESSVSGRETTPGSSRFEDHINGDVLFSLDQAAALGLVNPKDLELVTKGLKRFWQLRTTKRSDGRLEIKGVMSPDENHTGDNDLYTNLLAQWTLNGRRWDGLNKLLLPKDEVSFLNYEGDALRGYKQAGGILAIFPLQYPPAEKQAQPMMARFADRTIKNGPAMSRCINALIYARLGQSEKAYREWEDSWRTYAKPPLLLFSEKPGVPTTYFTTGAAGTLEAVLYGFLGIRIDSKKDQGAPWSKKLAGEHWLSIKPNLPNAWKSVTFKNFTLLGHRYTLTVTHKGLTVTQGE